MTAQFDPGRGVIAALPPSRVAYLVNQYPKVSHTFVRREIQALERIGVQVHRFAMRGDTGVLADAQDLAERKRTRYLLAQGAIPLALASLRTALSRPGQFLAALKLAVRMGQRAERPLIIHLVYLAQACLLLGWLRAVGAQHVHAHFGTNPAAVAMLTRVLGGPPYSFTVHGPEEFDKPEFIHLGLKALHAAFVVAISSYGRSQFYRWVDAAQWHKVHVVHCGLEADFHDVPPAPPVSAPRFVCVGRLCEQKGQLLLVQAVDQLVRVGIPVQLVLVGDGEMRADIEALVGLCHLEQHVSITGWVGGERVRDEILAARALVLPSFAEGLPVVLMEAMALRRPVITTFVAGIPELVRDGQEGWLVPAGDVYALAQALQQCLCAPHEQLSVMGEQARERALQRHSVDAEAAKLLELFRGAAAAGASHAV